MSINKKKNSPRSIRIRFALIALALLFGYFFLSENSVPEEIKTPEPRIAEGSARGSAETVETNIPRPEEPNQPESHSIDCGHDQCAVSAENTAIKTQQTTSIDLPLDFIDSLGETIIGNKITFPLPGGLSAVGVLTRKRVDAHGYPLSIEGTLEQPGQGRFMFQKEIDPGKAWPLSGVVIINGSDRAYRAEADPSGDGSAELVEYPVGNVFCHNFPALPVPIEENLAIEPALPSDHPTDIPIPDYQNGVIPLESLPGKTTVLYLDFDGEEGPHQSWGDFGCTSATNFTVENIFEIWRRVAEDFAPFNLNVTTDLQVYLDAPENTRQRIIITPTTDALPSAGGVAFMNSYNWSGDVPSWAFYSSGKSAAEVISHELGHTLGLSHDGRTSPSEGYYAGHGSDDVGWAPIMGVGYYETLSQWSKGEYNSANNTQDDTLLIAENNSIDLRIDDHGNTAGTASFLEILSGDTVKSDGTITTPDDVDTFTFTTTGGPAELNIDPESYGPNLDLLAELYDSSGVLLQSSNPDTAINATLSTNLNAGSYTLHISGTGRGDPLAEGYSDYGSLGGYAITGSVVGGLEALRFSIAESPANAAMVGTITPRNDHGTDPLSYAIASGNDTNAFALDPSSGLLTVADPTQFDYETLSVGFNDPAEFELSVTITNSVRSSLSETRRVVVTVTDINEAPVITSDSVFIPEGLRTGAAILQLSNNDPDHYDTHSWSIISATLTMSFKLMTMDYSVLPILRF